MPSSEPQRAVDASMTPAEELRRVHRWALGTFSLLMLALALLYGRYGEVDVWAAFRPSGELRHTHYSETVYVASIFRTWANTWSNMAFVLPGLYALAFGVIDRRQSAGWLSPSPHGTPPALTLIFGIACCYLGLGSGIFHASLTRWGQQLDVASMYPPMLALMAMLIHRNIHGLLQRRSIDLSTELTVGLLVALNTAAVYLYEYKWSMSSSTVLPLHIFTLASLFAVDRLFGNWTGRVPWLFASLLSLIAGVTCRQLDVAGKFSGPDAWYQGHAFWHLFCALSLALGWWYIRAGEERPAPAAKAATARDT